MQMALKPKNNNVMFNNLGNRSDYQLINNVFGNSEQLNKSLISYHEVPLEDITPRPINNYTQSRIERLAESIRATNGRLIFPIVIVKPSDLPDDSEILKKYKEDGVDVTRIKYVLVAGERRYRAFLLNRELKQKELDEKGSSAINPYNTITANILTKQEALNEQIYYKDSNDQARQLTPIEGLIHLKDITARINTNEDKRNCLIEMYGEENVVKDADMAARDFRLDKYIIYYLSKELGIEGWSESTVRAYLQVINKCDQKVIDEILSGNFPATEARCIKNFPYETQIKLVEMYKKNPSKYRSVYDQLSKKPEKIDKLGRKDIVSRMKRLNKALNDTITFIGEVEEELGKTDKNEAEKLKNKINDLILYINEYMDK